MVLAILYSKTDNYAVQYSAKCGCSLLRKLFLELHKDELENDKDINHHNINGRFPLLKEVDWTSLPNFVLVRNPYTRILSMFFDKYLNTVSNTIKKIFDLCKIKMPNNSFFYFIQVLLAFKKLDKLNYIDGHVQEQSYMFKKNKYTAIIKLENVNSELCAIYEILSINNENLYLKFIEEYKKIEGERIQNCGGSVNATRIDDTINFKANLPVAFQDFPFSVKPSAPSYWKFYTDSRVVDLVYSLYENDFKTFGYSKDSFPKPPL